ncbi:hypothetical protein Tsubulata_024000, partial [Turnera subulata]
LEGKTVSSGLCLLPELCNDEDSGDNTGIDLNLCYSIPYFSVLENDDSSNLEELIRGHKRLKKAPDIDGSIECNSNVFTYCGKKGSTNWPKLKFRDYVWAYTERYLAVEAMEEAAAAMMMKSKKIDSIVKEEVGGDGMILVQQLIACAEAVACRDKAHASVLLSELRANALVFGTSFQRVASCFVQGLTDRLAMLQELGAMGVPGPQARTVTFTAEKDEALRLAYEICPQIQFGHFVANASILEAIEGESSVHVVDLGMTLGLPQGQQWRELIHSLATRVGLKPCRLRITGVGNSAERLQEIGGELECCAQTVGLDFEFSFVESSLENLKAKDFRLFDGEIVVINSILQLHCVVKESRGALNSVLQVLHELSPRLLILVEQDSSHNGPFFLGRFMEALHYYSAIFDSLDAMLPKYDTKRAKIEQFFFAEEIKNIISCEGPARVERHERLDQWRRRMSRAGFHAAPLKMIMQAKQWLRRLNKCEGYTVTEEKGRKNQDLGMSLNALVRIPLAGSIGTHEDGLPKHSLFSSSSSSSTRTAQKLQQRQRYVPLVVQAKGKRAMQGRQYPKPPLLPKLEDDGNPKFVIFIRMANDEKEIQKMAIKQHRVLRSAKEFRYGYKIVENGNLRSALTSSNVIELPTPDKLKTVFDKVKDFFGEAKESFGKITALNSNTTEEAQEDSKEKSKHPQNLHYHHHLNVLCLPLPLNARV